MSGRMYARPSTAARIMLLFALGATSMLGASPPAQPEARVIPVVARRFAFEPSEIEVKVGERVTLAVRSADGVHGLAIPALDVNRSIPRGGDAVRIEFVAGSPGRFPIACSEYCGNGHDEMKGLLVVRAGGPADDGR